MFDYEVDGVRVGVAFLRSDSRIPGLERMQILGRAILMYCTDEREAKIAGESYEGKIFDTEKYYCLGGFSGRHLVAELDTEHGRSRMEMLVAEPIRGERN